MNANTTPGTEGIALAFAIDALSFLASTVTLFLMREQPAAAPRESAGESVLASIRTGIVYLWQTPALRTMYAIILVINLFFVGPFLVGIPVIADTRLKEGVAAYGLIMSAYGGGNLGGILLAGVLPKPSAGMLRMVTVVLIAAFGVGLAVVSLVNDTWISFAVMLLLGLGNGYISLTYITLIQQRTPENMLGRMMSLLMFANMGLLPIAEAATGALIKINLPAVFLGAGAVIVVTALWSATRNEILIDPRESVRQWSVASAD